MDLSSLFSVSGSDITVKVAVFVLVQVLVYLILSKSSNVFTSDSRLRSLSFKTARSVSIRRLLAAVSDLPGEILPSPSSSADGNDSSTRSGHWDQSDK